MRYLLTWVLIFFLSGCTNQLEGEFTKEQIAEFERREAEYVKYSRMDTPTSWGVGKKWIFIYVKENKIVNRLVVEPDSENVDSWSSGDWKKLNVIFEKSPMYFEHFSNVVPAYEVNGKHLTLMMAANISHTDSVKGLLFESSFVGSIENNNPYCWEPTDCINPSVTVYGVPLQ